MKINKIAALSFSALLFTGIFILFIHAGEIKLKEKSTAINYKAFAELSNGALFNFEGTLDNYITNLVSVSNALNYMKTIKERNSYLAQMSMRDNITAAYRLVKSRGDMKMINSDDTVNINNTDFFTSAIKGHRVTSTYTETYNGVSRLYIVIAMPVISLSTGFPTGVICEFIEPDVIVNSIPLNINESQLLLTDKNNTVIGSSQYEALEDNISPLQPLIEDPEFMDDLKNCNDNILLYSDDDYSQYVSYVRLNDPDWTIYVTMNGASFYIDTVEYSLYTIIIVIVYIFLLLILLVLFITPLIKANNRRKVEESQSLMFANVSHELRTPLNTIIGISEILSRSELSDGQLRQLAYISDSGKNLLAMINDLLDFSKLNSNKYELSNELYNMEDIIYDTTTVATIRLGDKPVDYLVHVSSYVPAQLIGDSLRVRQIITNVISNAVKYTQKGHIITTIDCEYLNNNKIRLIVKVEDTGIGIRKEDIHSIFDNYTRFDSYSNKHIEGTGLGMPIARKFARLMKGDITVESEYKRGSTFTISILQDITDDREPLLREPDKTADKLKSMIILEKSPFLASHYSLCLEDACINFEITDDNFEFSSKLNENTYDFILADYETIEMLREETDMPDSVTLISLVDTTANTDADGLTLYIPLFSIEIYSYLSGDNHPVKRHSAGQSLTIYTMPEKKILVVDDNAMNLQVASGIMEPYRMQIDTASSGESAINHVKDNEYDLILMDHMMPVMDGEEAMNIIRHMDNGRYSDIPVIACSANATPGADEMFMNMGFSDFISKPLDMYKLHDMLYKWLTPDDNAESYEYRHGSSPEHAGLEDEDSTYIDYKEGLARIGSMPIYLKTLRNFCDTIPRKKDIISFSFPNDIKTFTVEVHGLKGLAAIVSANELARQSLTLEMMGKSEDIDGIEPLLDDYYQYMTDVKLNAERFISDHT